MMVWSPDSCDCELGFSVDRNGQNTGWLASIKNCKLHVGLTGQNHWDTVFAHQGSIGRREQDETARQTERTRIRNL